MYSPSPSTKSAASHSGRPARVRRGPAAAAAAAKHAQRAAGRLQAEQQQHEQAAVDVQHAHGALLLERRQVRLALGRVHPECDAIACQSAAERERVRQRVQAARREAKAPRELRDERRGRRGRVERERQQQREREH